MRSRLARAILSLERNPAQKPESEADDLATEPIRGIEGLYRISVDAKRNPPGYRAIYFARDQTIYFIRFRYRDPTTYRGLRQDLSQLWSELSGA